MENELTLKEKFLLLCYEPEKGRPVSISSFMSYGIIGSLLLELAEAKKIELEDKKLIVIDPKPTGDKALDLILERIAKAVRPKKTKTWISILNNSGIGRKAKLIIRQSLVDKKILSQHEAIALLIFKYKRFPSRDTRPRRDLIENIQGVVLKSRIGTTHAMMLIALIGATQMTNSFFFRKDRTKARRRIKEILKSNELTKILDSTIATVQIAIISSVTATAVITSLSASSN